jgi:homoserine/homoserine lactone efflux protein
MCASMIVFGERCVNFCLDVVRWNARRCRRGVEHPEGPIWQKGRFRMISWPVALTFMATTGLLAITPGPNMSLIVANTLAGGGRRGFVTLAGALTGNAILISAMIAAMGPLMVFMSEWFDAIRWAGALYLLVLGLLQLRSYWRSDPVQTVPASQGSAFAQGLIVSMSNPKVLLFLGAFLPQFVDPAGDPAAQLRTLAILFIVVLAVADAGYTLVIARIRSAFPIDRLRVLDGLAGCLLVLGGLLLLAVRKPI